MNVDHATARRERSADPEPVRSEHLTRKDRAELMGKMLLTRISEERGLTLYKQGKVPGIVLRRARPGGDLGRRLLPPRAPRPALHPPS